MRSFFLAAVVVPAAVAAERLMTPHPASAAIAASADASEKMLRVEITVPAPRAEVWKAVATSEGLSTWLAPNSNVELEPGGEWMVHFPGGSTGGGNIVSFVPGKEIVIKALAHDQRVGDPRRRRRRLRTRRPLVLAPAVRQGVEAGERLWGGRAAQGDRAD